MQIENIISSLLTKYNKVIIPGLGILETAGGQGGSTSFTSNSVVEDTALVTEFSHETGLSFQESESKVNDIIKDLKRRLSENTSVEIPHAGTLQMDGNNIVFEAFKTSMFPSDFFGLGAMEDQEEHHVEEEKIIVETPKEIANELIVPEPKIEVPTPKVEPVVEVKAVVEPIVEKVKDTVVETSTLSSLIDTSSSSVAAVAADSHSNITVEEDDHFSINWKKIALILLLLFCLGFFVPYIIATYSGKNFFNLPPLWKTAKVEETKKEVKDTAIVSAEDASKSPIAKSTEETAKTPVQETSKSAPVATVKQPEMPKATPAKTPVAVAPAKVEKKVEAPKVVPAPIVKPVAEVKKAPVVSKKVEAKPVATAPKAVTKVSVPAKSASPAVVSTPKVVTPKNVTTAAYKKGVYYLSFGMFNNPNNAIKLRKDLSNYGIVTDIIQKDGRYVVSIAYRNKANAENASSQYPNTLVFE